MLEEIDYIPQPVRKFSYYSVTPHPQSSVRFMVVENFNNDLYKELFRVDTEEEAKQIVKALKQGSEGFIERLVAHAVSYGVDPKMLFPALETDDPPVTHKKHPSDPDVVLPSMIKEKKYEPYENTLGFRRRCAWCFVELRWWQLNCCRKCHSAATGSAGIYLSSGGPPFGFGSRVDAEPDRSIFARVRR